MKTKLPIIASMLFFSLSFSQISLVKDINPGAGDGVAVYNQNRIAYNGKLVFGAGDATTGNELWISDGTPSGTTLVSEILNSSAVGGSNPQKFYDFGGTLYFSARRPASNSSGTVGHQLYATDGTNAGTNTGFPTLSIQGNSNPANFIEYNNELIFTARISNSSVFLGEKLLAFDGNPWPSANYGEPIMVGSSADLDPENIIEFNGVLLYNAFTSAKGRELWQSNGLSSGIFMDINLGSSDSNPINLTIFNNKLYFSADNGSKGRELWETDGTVPGTQMVTDLYAGVLGSSPSNLTVHNNRLYFTASHPVLGTELFYVGTNGSVTSAANINPSASSNPSNLKSFNGKLYFTADNGVNGVEIWQSSGTSFTTIMLKDINTSGSSAPNEFTEYNSKLYFSADDGTNGRELWVTDGTNAGTTMVAIANPSGSFNPSDLIVANNLLFFSADDGVSNLGRELWRYLDPTLSNTKVEVLTDVELYPNPAKNEFKIVSAEEITQVSIHDIHGKMVKLFLNAMSSYDVETLSSGMYFVNIETLQGKVTKKLLKN